MSKKTIIFSYDFPPNDGGIARLCSEITSNLYSQGYNIQVLTTDHDGRNKDTYRQESFALIKKTSRRIMCEWQMFSFLYRIKDKDNYLILCGLWYPEGLIALLAGFTKVYILTHAAELRPGKSAFRKKIWIPLFARGVLKRARKIIANSEYTADLSRRVSPGANIVPLPLGVNHQYFKPNPLIKKEPEYFIICTVSRICKFKGHDTILNSIQNLPINIRKRVRWKIAGNGPYQKELMHLVNKAGLTSQIEFLGFVPDIELPAIYQQSDVFVLCTREDSDSQNVEGFGLVFLEAQACGIPAIGTRIGGIPSAIKESDGGWLIETETELTKLFTELVNNKKLCEDMGQKARDRVEREATWEVYTDLLKKYLEI
ncbi:MAG: glycosyltransferase family 4 protein [Eubacteriales bacterium]